MSSPCYFVEVTPELTRAELRAKLGGIVSGYEEIIMTLAEQWRKEGREEGLKEGLKEGRIDTLRRLLTSKFSTIPPELDAKLAAATLEQLDRYTERVLTATTIEAVFAARS